MIGLEVADARSHRPAALEHSPFRFAYIFAAVGDVYAVDFGAAVAQIHERRFYWRGVEDCGLLPLLGDRMPS